MTNIDSNLMPATVKAVSRECGRDNFSWNTLCDCVAETFRFTEQEKKAFRQNRTARLIGAIPFAAGCEEPARTALAHLSVYMIEIRGGRIIGGHTPEDNASPLARLRLISSFKGGDRDIIDHGMYKLALIMLRGYEQSKDDDAWRYIYNPLNDGSWDAEAMKAELTRAHNAHPCEALDVILPDAYGVVILW
jgi:hypothetical protein